MVSTPYKRPNFANAIVVDGLFSNNGTVMAVSVLFIKEGESEGTTTAVNCQWFEMMNWAKNKPYDADPNMLDTIINGAQQNLIRELFDANALAAWMKSSGNDFALMPLFNETPPTYLSVYANQMTGAWLQTVLGDSAIYWGMEQALSFLTQTRIPCFDLEKFGGSQPNSSAITLNNNPNGRVEIMWQALRMAHSNPDAFRAYLNR